MNMIDSIIGHLDFTEAIQMAVLTEQANHIAQHRTAAQMRTHYNALYQTQYPALHENRSIGWHCVHAIRHADEAGQTVTWALILQQAQSANFTVVCGHWTEDDILGIAQTTSIEIPSLSKLWESLQEWMANQSVAYVPADAKTTMVPPNAKVYQPWLAACQAIQNEIDLFFRALGELKFAQYRLDRLPRVTPAAAKAYCAAIEAALQLRVGPERSQTFQEAVANSNHGQLTIPTALIEDKATVESLWPVPDTGLKATFVGHGMGGAVAALVALQMKQSWELHLDFPLVWYQLYTFGSPKVGNRAFADYFHQLFPDSSHCVQNLMDTMIYAPLDEVPLPNSLTSGLPKPVAFHLFNTDVLNLRKRLGIESLPGMSNDNWVMYEHVGTPFVHSGLGNASPKLNFPMQFKPPAVPFDHDATGYKTLLVDAQVQYQAMAKPAQQLSERLQEGRQQFASTLKEGTYQMQLLFNQVQSLIEKCYSEKG